MKPSRAKPVDAADQRRRLRGLLPAQAETLRKAVRAVQAGDRLMAGQLLYTLAQAAPDHPEVLRWSGIHHANLGEWPVAVRCLERCAAIQPGDFDVLLLLAVAHNHNAAFDAALAVLRDAAGHAEGAEQWLALSIECDRQGHVEEALQAAQRALALNPAQPLAVLQRARCLKAVGQAEGAAADCRALIAQGQLLAQAWFSLVDLKTVPLQGSELARLEQWVHAPGPATPSAQDQVLLAFALGKALEDSGQHAQAFAVLERANLQAAALHPWDAALFSAQADAVRKAFSDAGITRGQSQGEQVIFLVGLPRSGTTLVEQVLASHSQVEGSSELPYLQAVMDEESRRRATAFPIWVPQMESSDWTRLGARYLQLSERWRRNRPVCTDKLPSNWLLAGAALAMLPDARFVDCRRDALETCWSCYKQLFGPGQAGFSYSLASLARYWHDYERLSHFWSERHFSRYRLQRYEDLVAQPETQIRELLAFCGLTFEAGCLSFHEAQRPIRTPSALQVRQPMRRTSTPAAGYGPLLDPLRSLLWTDTAD